MKGMFSSVQRDSVVAFQAARAAEKALTESADS